MIVFKQGQKVWVSPDCHGEECEPPPPDWAKGTSGSVANHDYRDNRSESPNRYLIEFEDGRSCWVGPDWLGYGD